MELTLFVVFALALLPGIAMAFVPGLPSMLYLTTLALLYGFLNGFERLTVKNIIILAILAAAAWVIEYSAGLVGANLGGARKRSMLWGFLGLIVGATLFFPFGGVLGLFTGILLSELSMRRPRKEAFRAATSSALGVSVGIAINILLATVFFTLFIIFAFS